ncbi:MAG: hypothetical protein Q9188_007402 [Gyalolechia gomerana]
MVSIYRATVVTGVRQEDMSYTSTKRAIWSGVEICTGIVCANLATLRPILKYLSRNHSLSSDTSGKDSSRITSGRSKSFYQGWTWRNVKPAAGANNDGRSHLLASLSPVQKLDDIERQKYEEYMMPPVNSPRIPETAHF